MKIHVTMPDPKPRAVAAAFLISCALILLQVSFSRLIGYKLFYHFVFLAISLSLLGLGAAGTYVAITARPANEDRSILRWLAALAVSVPVAFLLIANPFGVTHHPPVRIKLLGTDAIAYLVWCSPLMVWLNFCGGVVLTRLFSRYSHRMGRLYAADLLGAGAGSLLCVGLMKYGSPPVAFVAAAAVAIVAAVPFHRALERADRTRSIGLVAAATTALLAIAIFAGPAELRNFERFRTAEGTRRGPAVIKYEWNHLIRTDHFPGWYRLDGEAATQIVAWSPQERAKGITKPEYVIAPPHPEVAIIGVGGGRQLAEARRAEARHITAIDINPTIMRWVQNEDRVLTQDLFIDPSIDLRVGEGRHAVRSSGRTFDVVVLHAIDTYAATASGAYALSENFLYTKEAIQDYYRSLSARGVLSISRWLFNPPRENLRLFGTAIDALRDMGVDEPLRHLVMIAPIADYAKLGDRRVWGYLLLTRTPLDAERLALLRADVARRHWTFLFVPDEDTNTPFDQLAFTHDREGFQADYPYLVSTVTDSNPYLFQFYNPLHRTAYAKTGDWATSQIYQWSAITLVVTLAVSTALGFVAIIVPLLWVKHRATAPGDAVRPALGLRQAIYFAGLGVGYMALEIPIIQVLSLYLGHPTYGFSVVLVALLVSSGIGSLLADRSTITPSTVCGLIGALLALVTVAIFAFVHATLDQPDFVRFAAALALVFALGVPMGMPLALGVRRIGRDDSRSVAWAWAINGMASVVGSCLVMISMVFAGSHVALAGGALCYAIASLAGRSWNAKLGPVVSDPIVPLAAT